MIVEEPLPFPEGKAAAEVLLKAGENPGPGAFFKILALSGGIGALVKLAAASGLRVDSRYSVAGGLSGEQQGGGGISVTNLSPALLGLVTLAGSMSVGIVVFVRFNSVLACGHSASHQQFFMGSDPELAQRPA